MVNAKVDLLLHPLRMRILVAVSGRQVTAQQLVHELPDIPQATLYRHLNLLAQHGILSVVEERRVRGTVEKVYALEAQAVRFSPEDVQQLSTSDHFRYFTTFITSLLSDFGRYLDRHDASDVAADVRYHKGSLYLSDEEFQQLQQDVRTLLMPLLSNDPTPERRRRIFATVLLPDENESAATPRDE